jgi:hypothetical protein
MRYKNKWFVRLVLGVASLLLTYNLLTVNLPEWWLPLVPAGFQALVIVAVYFRWRIARLAVRAWSLFFIAGGGAYLLSTTLGLVNHFVLGSEEALGNINWGLTAAGVIMFSMGYYFFSRSGRYMLYEEGTDAQDDQERVGDEVEDVEQEDGEVLAAEERITDPN